MDAEGERLIVGTRDANMPAGTSWLPLERVDKAAMVMADIRWLEAVRAVFSHARMANVPTLLDADVGGRDALTEILALTDYAIFSEEALADYMPDLELPSATGADNVTRATTCRGDTGRRRLHLARSFWRGAVQCL